MGVMDALCQCGCGGVAPIAKHTCKRFGWVKGEPLRFIRFHARRPKLNPGYKYYSHGGATSRKAHLIKAEQVLGRPLPLGACVHHADGTKNEYAPLVICQDHGYHMLLHARTRVVKAGGNPNTDKICCDCRVVKARALFNSNSGRCRACERIRDLGRRRPGAKPRGRIRSDCGPLA